VVGVGRAQSLQVVEASAVEFSLELNNIGEVTIVVVKCRDRGFGASFITDHGSLASFYAGINSVGYASGRV